MSYHATTLREMADRISHVIRQKASAHTGQVADGDLKLAASHAACLAGADALRRGTCANCDHRIDWPDAIGCNNARGLGRDEVSPDDFCSEWAPRKDAPTEPTR